MLTPDENEHDFAPFSEEAAADREFAARLRERERREVALAADLDAVTNQLRAAAVQRPPLTQRERRTADARNARARRMTDRELLAIALDEICLTTTEFATAMEDDVETVERYWAHPESMPVSVRRTLAAMLEVRVPDYAPLAAELTARTESWKARAFGAARARAIDKLTPAQMDDWDRAFADVAQKEGSAPYQAMMTVPADEGERLMREYGHQLTQSIAARDAST